MREPGNRLTLTRRECIAALSGAAVGALSISRYSPAKAHGDNSVLPAVRAITKGPRHHWFGYYDKLQFDPSQRYVLGMKVDFEGRSPTADDYIRVGMVDLQDQDRWIDLGVSHAWCWQQGCMLQWLPESDNEVIWNDREGDQFVSRVVNVTNGQQRTLPKPIYSLSPDGKTAIGLDFHRLDVLRPGYGYKNTRPYSRDSNAPKDTGLYSLNLESGESQLIFSYADALAIPYKEDISSAIHWFNHVLFSPNGQRFIFLNRWKKDWTKGGWKTRMLTIQVDGSDPYVVDPSGNTSHFIWRDAEHILAWTQPIGKPPGFYLFTDKTQQTELIGKEAMTENGHCTYLPGNRWILCDTYPDADRLQHPYLFEVATGRRVELGHFHSPAEYTGEWRCDTHPRFSRDGKLVVIDSPHADGGRQMYLIDVSEIVS